MLDFTFEYVWLAGSTQSQHRIRTALLKWHLTIFTCGKRLSVLNCIRNYIVLPISSSRYVTSQKENSKSLTYRLVQILVW